MALFLFNDSNFFKTMSFFITAKRLINYSILFSLFLHHLILPMEGSSILLFANIIMHQLFFFQSLHIQSIYILADFLGTLYTNASTLLLSILMTRLLNSPVFKLFNTSYNSLHILSTYILIKWKCIVPIL